MPRSSGPVTPTTSRTEFREHGAGRRGGTRGATVPSLAGVVPSPAGSSWDTGPGVGSQSEAHSSRAIRHLPRRRPSPSRSPNAATRRPTAGAEGASQAGRPPSTRRSTATATWSSGASHVSSRSTRSRPGSTSSPTATAPKSSWPRNQSVIICQTLSGTQGHVTGCAVSCSSAQPVVEKPSSVVYEPDSLVTTMVCSAFVRPAAE